MDGRCRKGQIAHTRNGRTISHFSLRTIGKDVECYRSTDADSLTRRTTANRLGFSGGIRLIVSIKADRTIAGQGQCGSSSDGSHALGINQVDCQRTGDTDIGGPCPRSGNAGEPIAITGHTRANGDASRLNILIDQRVVGHFGDIDRQRYTDTDR